MPKRSVVTLADKVRAARKRMNLSQLELAAKAGVRPEVISRIETGRSPGSLMSLPKIAPVLGLSIEDLTKTDTKPTRAKKGKTA